MSVSVFSSERRGSRSGRVPSGPPVEPRGVLGGGDRGSLLPRRARDRLRAGRRARPSLPAEGGEAAEKGSVVFPRRRMGPRERT